MKNILLIGAGRFGRHIAVQLSQLGHQVMTVDLNEERINDVLPFTTNAQIGDSTNPSFCVHLASEILMSVWSLSVAISRIRWKRPPC